MPLFGDNAPKNWGDRLSLIGGGLYDAGSALQGQSSNRLAGVEAGFKQRADEQAQKDALAEAYALFGGGQQPETQMQPMAQVPAQAPIVDGQVNDPMTPQDMGPVVAPQVQAQPAQNPYAQFAPVIAKIVAAGGDPSAILDLIKQQAPNYQGANLGDGGYGSFDPRTGEFKVIRAPDGGVNNDLQRQYLQAQIDSQKALGGQREASGSYYEAKAKQPYAPPRKSTGSSNGKKGGSNPALEAIAAELRRRGKL